MFSWAMCKECVHYFENMLECFYIIILGFFCGWLSLFLLFILPKILFVAVPDWRGNFFFAWNTKQQSHIKFRLLYSMSCCFATANFSPVWSSGKFCGCIQTTFFTRLVISLILWLDCMEPKAWWKKKTKNIIEKNQLVDKISHSIGKDQMCDIQIHCSWGLDVKDEMSNEHVPNESIY